MDILEKIKQAIIDRKPISFEYSKKDKIKGIRTGNPYVIFRLTSRLGEKSTKVHIVQTGGVSDSKNKKPFPDFRMFNLEYIYNVTVLKNNDSFVIDEKYNPFWEGYNDFIIKV